MRKLLFGAILLGGFGCTGVQTTGPLARWTGANKDASLPAAKDALLDAKDAPPAANPQVMAARPVPPARLIDPEDVTVESAAVAAQKLQNEFDADRKTMPAAPRTAEVSVYKGGEKVR